METKSEEAEASEGETYDTSEAAFSDSTVLTVGVMSENIFFESVVVEFNKNHPNVLAKVKNYGVNGMEEGVPIAVIFLLYQWWKNRDKNKSE